jgi:hypothetical protein
MRRPPYIGLAVAAGLILLVSLFVFRRYLPYVGSSLAPKTPPSVVLQMRNAYFVGLNRKGKLWSLKAKSVEIGQNRFLTTLTGITQGKIFDAGKPVLQMEAGRAVYNSMVGDMAMDEGILLIGADGQRLTADGADWNSAASSLRSTGKVYYESPWAKGSTEAVFVDTKSRELTMYNVDVTVDLSKADKGQHAL